jgi:hypothetical protein
MVRDHRAHMAHLYDARDRELSDAWRRSTECIGGRICAFARGPRRCTDSPGKSVQAD